MLSSKNILPAVGLALLSGTALASADEHERSEYYERRGPIPFEVLDLDGDHAVTAAEHAMVRAERHAVRAALGYPMRNARSAPSFDAIDGDGDGSLSRNELSSWQAQHRRTRCRGR
jgi:hypothetical protein